MEVYKFGGASLVDAQAIRNVVDIITTMPTASVVVVVSAIGKTTNQLENLLAKCRENPSKALECFEEIRQNHLAIQNELFSSLNYPHLNRLEQVIDKLWQVCDRGLSGNYDLDYDQLVSFGELMSSALITSYMESLHIPVELIDIRSYLLTDEKHREAKVIWQESARRINERFKSKTIYLTQGFIGGTKTGKTTTLGREGSDYSAAIIGNILDAEKVTVWKDVKGLLNADPKWHPQTVKLEEMSYQEAMELSFYGAQVLHPKSIKPLFEKNIPLVVRSFLERDDPGTRVQNLNKIDHTASSVSPSIYIRKENQSLISLSPRDGSFIIEDHIPSILAIFTTLSLKINIFQVSALEFSLCIDSNKDQMITLQNLLNGEYRFKYNTALTLYTIHHYNSKSLDQVKNGHRKMILKQKTRSTLHIIME